MLYKKKDVPKFDYELFKNPSAEYRSAPFWGWNCELEEEELLRQIDIFEEMGFGGFHMHPRSGMKTEYMGEKFMSLVKACVERAKEKGMLAWLYDEDRWASGSAGGFVTSIKKYRARVLEFTVEKKDDATEKQDAIENGKPYLLKVFDVVLNQDGTMKSYKIIDENASAEGTKWFVYSANQKELGWYNGNTYVDTFNPEAIDKFLEVTHEAYYKKVGEEFGKTVPAIFTDEPHHSDMDQLALAADTNNFTLSWTHDFDKTFFEENEFDILEKLPELVWNLENNEVSYARYCYHNHACNRLMDAFISKMGKWCREHNLILTGHMSEEDSLLMQTRLVGEQMRAYPHFGIPGVDMLCDSIYPTSTKQVQSVVHQYGKEGMIVEHCGVTNWTYDFKDHKFHSDWLMAAGVTARVHHGSWVSAKGMGKRDFPASINYQSPWYKEYSYVEDHCARVATVLTRGTPIVKVGVIHPIESLWLYFGVQENNEDMQRTLDENFQNVAKWLIGGAIDFDYISEELLCNIYKGSNNGEFGVGEMKYSAIVVPECITLRKSTLEKLEEFKNNGGKLIFMGQCPRYVDAKRSDAVKKLFEISDTIAFNRTALLDSLKKERIIEIRNSSGTVADNLIHTLRNDGDYKWLFIAHIVKNENMQGHITSLISAAKPQNIVVKMKGEYKPLLFDTISGETREISYYTKNGMTVIPYDLYAHDSLLLRFEKSDEKELTIEENKPEIVKVNTLKTKVSYKREEDNVYILDIAEFSEDGINYNEKEEIRRIDTSLNIKYGYPTLDLDDYQPWARKKSDTHNVWLKFRIFSDIDIKGCDLACEEIISAEFNGEKLHLDDNGWYFDRSIRRYRLPEIKKGENILVVQVPFSNMLSLENMFVLGDFDVKVEGIKATILPKTEEIAFGSIVSQGMPFYGGNITYTAEIDVPEGGVQVQVANFEGALLKVCVDGKDEKVIAYSPYVYKADNLQGGKHRFEFKFFGNRYNTFAALHNCGNMKWAGPNMWFTKGSDWCYEYNLRKTGILTSPIFTFTK